jgi:hypothetical protein
MGNYEILVKVLQIIWSLKESKWYEILLLAWWEHLICESLYQTIHRWYIWNRESIFKKWHCILRAAYAKHEKNQS